MSTRDLPETDPWDVVIGLHLKNWVAEFTPPKGGRERLLQSAYLLSRKHNAFWFSLMNWIRYGLNSLTGSTSDGFNASPLQYAVDGSSALIALSARTTMLQFGPAWMRIFGFNN